MTLCSNLEHQKNTFSRLFVISCSLNLSCRIKGFFFSMLVCSLLSESGLLSYEVHYISNIISLLLQCLWWKLHQGREIIATGRWNGKNNMFTVSNSVLTVMGNLPHCQQDWLEVTCTKNKLQALRSLAALFALVLCDHFRLNVTNWWQWNVLKWWLLPLNIWISF